MGDSQRVRPNIRVPSQLWTEVTEMAGRRGHSINGMAGQLLRLGLKVIELSDASGAIEVEKDGKTYILYP